MGERVLGNARAAIGDPDRDLTSADDLRVEGDRARFTCVAEGVAQEVAQGAQQEVAVAASIAILLVVCLLLPAAGSVVPTLRPCVGVGSISFSTSRAKKRARRRPVEAVGRRIGMC